MALKEGKKLVNLKSSVADNIGVPKFPTTNVAAEISTPIAEAISAFRKVAESDAAVQFKTSFNETSTNHYLDLKNKFEFDPDGMKNAVDAYSKTTIANTPLVYREYTSNILAQKNLANLNYASTNFKNLNTQKAIEGFVSSRTDHENLFSSNMDNILNDGDAGWFTMNTYFANTTMKNLNEIYGTAEDNLVNTNRYKGTTLKKNLENDLTNVEVLRVVNVMKQLTNDNNKGTALVYLNDYAANKDSKAISDNLFENPKDVNNPIYQKYKAHIGNEFNRKDIVKKALDLYENYNGDKIKNMMLAKKTYDLSGLQEPGGVLNVVNFEDAKNSNPSKYVTDNFPGIKATQFNEAVGIVQTHIQTQELVSDAKNGKAIKFNGNETLKSNFAKAILANHGINDENITDVTNPKFAEAMSLLKSYNITPDAVIKRLNTKVNVDYNEQGQVEIYRENLALYKYMQGLYPNMTIDNAFIYEEGLDMGATALSDNKVLAAKLNNVSKDTDKYKETKININTNLSTNANEVVDAFSSVISNLDINTDSWWAKKFFLSEKNQYTDLFHNSGTTLLPSRASTLLTEDVKAKWLEATVAQLTHLNGIKNFDITTDEGKKLFRHAALKGLDILKDQGFSGTKFSGNGSIKMVNKAYEDTIGFQGQGFENSIIAQGNYLMNTLSDAEQKERFGIKESKAFPIIGKTTIEANNINDIIKTEIDNGFQNTIIEFAGTYNKYGQPNYHLKINHNNTLINLTEGDNYFDPTGFAGVSQITGKSANRKQLINTLAEEKYSKFMDTHGHLLDGDGGMEAFAKNVIFKTIKMGIEASDYKFYPDIPLLNDVPAEVKPFAFIFKTLGIDADLKPYYDEGIKINNEIKDKLSLDARIQSNSRITPKDKLIESVFPPHKMKYTNANLGLKYKQFVYDNYQDTSLPLTFRTNNYMAVMKTDSAWVGEMTDVNTGNQAAVFASPIDSIRAGVRVMINNSTLINNNTTKRYGDEPTLGEILSVYAVNSDIYLQALEEKTEMTRDTQVNFLDSTQMHKIVKFMIEHEMGSEAFNNYYSPSNQLFLDSMIMEGYELGINSYGGKLGKIR
jgi:hypothetical protein